MKRDVLIITGPTASGKSAHALRLAEARPSVIINADAMQLYRELPILTAQPDAAERARAPHRLYSVLDASDPANAARWVAMAAAEIRAAWEGRLQPILVGGTGMYLKSLIHGIAPMPNIPAELRDSVRTRWAEAGNTALHAWLSEADPASAARLFPGDTQRLIRAAEVFEATGRSITDWQAERPQLALPEAHFRLMMLERDRQALYDTIDRRFEAIVKNGGLEEAKALHVRALPRDLPLLRAHGVPELLAHLDGALALDDAVRRAQQNTRNYAKRQWTWLRNQFPGIEAIGDDHDFDGVDLAS